MKQSATRSTLLSRCAYSFTFALTTLCYMICHNVSAAEQAAHGIEQAETFTYDPATTKQLKQLYDTINDPNRQDLNYQENRPKLKELVDQAHANPNVACFSIPLLSMAVMHNDYEFTQLLLARRADPNTGLSLPLFHAQTSKIARLLVANKADLHVSTYRGNLLHDAARNNKPAKIIAFLCNAGVDCNSRNYIDESPVDTLFLTLDENEDNTKMLAAKATVFLWTGSDLNSKDKQGETALDILRKKDPALVPHMQARMHVMPQVKSEKEQEYQQNIGPLLATHITKDLAALVVQFMGPPTPLPWHKSYLPEVELRIAQAVVVTQKPAKRLRSSSMARAQKKR